MGDVARTVRDAAYVPFTRPYLTQSVAVALNRVKATEFGRHCPNLYQVERLALEPNQLGMARNTILEQGLKRHVPGARPVFFDSVDEAWGRVASGELGAALGSEVALKYLLASRAGDNVNVKLCEMRSTNLDTSIVVRPDAPHLLRWLDVYLSQPVFPVDADSVLVGPSPFEWRFRAVREGDN